MMWNDWTEDEERKTYVLRSAGSVTPANTNVYVELIAALDIARLEARGNAAWEQSILPASRCQVNNCSLIWSCYPEGEGRRETLAAKQYPIIRDHSDHLLRSHSRFTCQRDME